MQIFNLGFTLTQEYHDLDLAGQSSYFSASSKLVNCYFSPNLKPMKIDGFTFVIGDKPKSSNFFTCNCTTTSNICRHSFNFCWIY